jgi:protein tyrosine phosphatase
MMDIDQDINNNSEAGLQKYLEMNNLNSQQCNTAVVMDSVPSQFNPYQNLFPYALTNVPITELVT